MNRPGSSCSTAHRNASAWVDGCLTEQDWEQMRSHLGECASCAAEVKRYERMRAALRATPKRPVPTNLSSKLRVTASRESLRRRQRLTLRSMWIEARDNTRLFMHNLMRPLALPMAGGLASTVVLFGMLIPTFTVQRVTGTDVPINEALYTQAALYVVSPVGYCDDNITVDVLIDQQGKMIEYSFPDGKPVRDPALLRGLENALLFTSYKPATYFGQPTPGRVRLTFRRTDSEVDVKG